MFKSVNKLKSDNRGFTLVELLVTLTIMLIALTLTGELATVLYKNYKVVEDRWVVQTEVDFIMKAFQANSSNESLTTANFVDMFCENMDAAENNLAFASCPELGSFTESDDGILTFEKANTESIYLFCYKNYFYVLNRGQTNAFRLCMSDEIQVNVTFEVAVNVREKDAATGKWSTNTEKYLPNALTVTVESGDIYTSKYTLHTSFSFDNMNQGQQINMIGGSLTSPYVAGWTSGTELENYPDATYCAPNKTIGDYQYLTQPANIIRYVSATSYFAQADVGDGTMNSSFTCGTRFAMAGSKFEAPVIDTLHKFRDNVLKGNVLGDFIIEKYYDWSPKIIEIASSNKIAKVALKTFVMTSAAVAYCFSQ